MSCGDGYADMDAGAACQGIWPVVNVAWGAGSGERHGTRAQGDNGRMMGFSEAVTRPQKAHWPTDTTELNGRVSPPICNSTVPAVFCTEVAVPVTVNGILAFAPWAPVASTLTV